MQQQHQADLDQVDHFKAAVQDASNRLADAKRGREDDNDRPANLVRLNKAVQERKALEAEYEILKENDPAVLAELEKELVMVTHAAKRWTDNVFEAKAYLKKKMNYNEKDACKALGVPASFDCKYCVACCCCCLFLFNESFSHPSHSHTSCCFVDIADPEDKIPK